jgi:hypothetical protein
VVEAEEPPLDLSRNSLSISRGRRPLPPREINVGAPRFAGLPTDWIETHKVICQQK